MRWEDVSDEQLIEEVRNRGYTIQNGEIVMSKQPEALRLIDWFDEEDGFQHGTKAPHKWVLQTAAELRRLHAENEQLRADALVMLEKLRDWTLQYTDQEQPK